MGGCRSRAASCVDALDRVQFESIDDLARRLATAAAQPPAWLAQVDPRVLSRNVGEIHAAALAADASSFFGRKKRRRAVLASSRPTCASSRPRSTCAVSPR